MPDNSFSYFWTNLGPISPLAYFYISGQTSVPYWSNLIITHNNLNHTHEIRTNIVIIGPTIIFYFWEI